MLKNAARLQRRFAGNIKFTFVTKEGKEVPVTAAKGETLLEVSQENGLKVEGACGGNCVCSTCHMILEQKAYDKLPAASSKEEDQLDFALEVTPTSRLGCQIVVTEALEGTKITLPSKTRNFWVDKEGAWKLAEDEVRFFFIKKDGSLGEAIGKIGQTILQVAKANDIPVEGACEASLACSTCHIILPEELVGSVSEPTMTEEDLLDLAYDVTPTSRLGCQIKVSKDFEGVKITLPKRTKNFKLEDAKKSH